MPLTFLSDVQRRCYDRVAIHLREAFGESVQVDPNAPRFQLWQGSARAEVRVDPWRGDLCRIVVRAVVLSGVRTTPGLLTFLLDHNDKVDLGAFSVTPQDEIVFQDAIVVHKIDPSALIAVVHTVLTVADTYDDKLREKWGGLRALDRTRPRPAVTRVDSGGHQERTATGIGVMPAKDDED
jgi:hypothetical protein